MPRAMEWVERLAQRIGGPRVMALPLLRFLAVLSGYTWLVLSPIALPAWHLVNLTMLMFLLYSVGIVTALWFRTGRVLRYSLVVMFIDVAFALTLIRLTGGVGSTLFLSLLLIAGLQSYYYGIRRGILVAAGSAAAYLVVVWSTMTPDEWANMAIRLSVLLGTAVAVGIVADIEDAERGRVLALTARAQEREAFIASVVDGLNEGVVALDREARIVAWNRAMTFRYGSSASEVLGRNFFTMFPAVEREPWGADLKRLLAGEIEEFVRENVEHETRRGTRVIQNLKGGLLRERGEPAGVVLLIEDITDQVALEHSARQAEKLASLGTLAAGLAHELNNPIGIISSRIELMMLEAEGQGLPAEVREDLAVLQRHSQRVARIVAGLLSFARQSPGAHGAVDLNRVVEETMLLVEKQVAKDGVRLHRALAPALPTVRGDANALQQVLMNLVLNARDAMPGGGEVSIETGVVPGPQPHVRLVVRDTGPGIPANILPKIFDPFFTTKSHGTGLGLAISYGIVRDHQGTVDVQTEPGRGTAFVVALPAASRGVAA